MINPELIKDIDDLAAQVVALEKTTAVARYLEVQAELEQGLKEMRLIVQEEGDFQSTFFTFRKIKKMRIKASEFIEYLRDKKKLTKNDEKVLADKFTEETFYGEARRIKTGDSETSL